MGSLTANAVGWVDVKENVHMHVRIPQLLRLLPRKTFV